MSVIREFIKCDLCKGRAKLWLHGNDYVGCPQCQETGKIEVVEERVQRPVKKIFIPGMKPFELQVSLPRSSLADIVIPRRT